MKLHLKFWDWKSIVGTIIIFLGIIFFIYYAEQAGDIGRERLSKDYMGKTRARVISFEAKNGMSQSKTGSRIIIQGYNIKYSFLVRAKEYISIDFIPNSINNSKFIQSNIENFLDSISIKYDINNPKKSQVIINK